MRKRVKPLDEYFILANLGDDSQAAVRALGPVFAEIRKDFAAEFLEIMGGDYQKLDKSVLHELHLKVKMVEAIEAQLDRQIVEGQRAKDFIKEHQK